MTAGQNYYSAVEIIDKNGNSRFKFDSFETENPEHNLDNAFTSVSVITHGFKFPTEGAGIPDNIYDLGNNIADSGGDGLVMRYNRDTGSWDAIDEQGRLLSDVEISDYYGKPLVLLTDWSAYNQSSVPDSGFSEGAADAFFASLVQLDQQLGGGGTVKNTKGKLVNKHGAVFNSPLHFIGFSRGTVVNSEMIQRIGTHFPHAGGPLNADGTPQLDSEGSEIRDLQMTTIDPHDFEQPGFSFPGWVPVVGGEGFADFNEPEVQVWENVTFADNYYQTVPKLEELTATPAGRLIDNADLNVFLGTNSDEENYQNSRAGFTRETDDLLLLGGRGATHGRVLSWYDGTTNLSVTKSPDELYRRLGDGYHNHLYDPDFPGVPNPWYTPDHNKATFELGDENAPWEGIGTGWFYSVLGGGKDLRPESNLEERVSVSFDNTAEARMRGDFAVPTLFNGNFDAVFNPNGLLRNAVSDAVPGWSVDSDASTSSEASKPKLVDWHDIKGLEIRQKKKGKDVPGTSHLEMLRIDRRGQNYALELQNNNNIKHDPFVVPEWGALRFDLHVPKKALGDGTLKVTIEDTDSANKVDKTFLLQEVALTEDGSGVLDNYVEASRKVDYAPYGFDTFQLDVPDSLRGKTATVKFEVNGATEPIYLDNVFFKSPHLKFGNPSEARANPSEYRNNFLIERPEYTLSYNGDNNILNWASWQVNKSWVFPADKDTRFLIKNRNFKSDITLPSDFYQVLPKDYKDDSGKNNIELEETKTDKKGNPVLDEDGNPQTETVKYVYGHAVPVAARDRNHRDNLAISLLSNIVPQTEKSNNGVWQGFEGYVKSFIKKAHNKEVQVIAGTHGVKDVELPARGEGAETSIKIPQYLWQVILVTDRPGLGVEDVTENTYTLGLWMPNNKTPDKTSAWKLKENGEFLYVNSVNEIEAKTGYDFFSNLPDGIEEKIENNTNISFRTDIPDAPKDS